MATRLERIGENKRTFVPAAGHDWFLPLYDPLVKLLGAEPARRRLLAQATLRTGHRVLDIGCGTGSLVTLVKRLHPEVEVVGLDPDPKALTRARRKAKRAAVAIQLDQGFANELPYRAASFDRVLSSFMFHHLEPDDKIGALLEVRRVLQPGGSFHLLDFGGPDSAGGLLSRWLHSIHRLKDNTESQILDLMTQAGFSLGRTVGHGRMFFGGLSITFYQASAPTS